MPDNLRRADDMRIEKIESAMDGLKEDVSAIKIKIFNGFSSKIDSTENKVTYIDEQNKKDHELVRSDIKVLSSKFDRMMWFLVTSSIGITSGIVLSIVKGWI